MMMQAVTATVTTSALTTTSSRPSVVAPSHHRPGLGRTTHSHRHHHDAARRGSTVAAHAKKSGGGGKKKKAAAPEPEPVVEDEDDEDDEDAEDAEIAADAEDGEEREVGDASELLPGADEYEEEEEEEAVQTSANTGGFGTAVGVVKESLANPAVKNLGILGLSVLAGSFALSCYKVYMKYNSSRSKRKRQVNKNVVVVERLRDFFPDNRDSLTKGHIRGLQGKTGFKPEEIFRKYMRYKLNEEVFNLDFVADVLALKAACELDDDTMQSVLLETGERMVKKYGILMRDVSEMGSAGVQRKMDGCSMFTKVMYLADLEEFISRAEGEMVQQRLKEIFGATDEDYDKLRITGLGSEKMDISVLEAMITEKPKEDGGDGGGEEPTPA